MENLHQNYKDETNNSLFELKTDLDLDLNLDLDVNLDSNIPLSDFHETKTSLQDKRVVGTSDPSNTILSVPTSTKKIDPDETDSLLQEIDDLLNS